MIARKGLMAAFLVLALPGFSHHASGEDGFRAIPDASMLQWKENAAVLLGTQRAVVDGDPSQAGPFVLRFRCPDKYRIDPHFHPEAEAVTVLEGTLHAGIGEDFDHNALVVVRTGGFLRLPKDIPHFGFCEGTTVLEIHAIGPWGTKLPDDR